MWVNPREWELSVKCRPGNAGVLPALSEMSDVSWMSGRRSAIAPRRAGKPIPLLLPRKEFQPLAITVSPSYSGIAALVFLLGCCVGQGCAQIGDAMEGSTTRSLRLC